MNLFYVASMWYLTCCAVPLMTMAFVCQAIMSVEFYCIITLKIKAYFLGIDHSIKPTLKAHNKKEIFTLLTRRHRHRQVNERKD